MTIIRKITPIKMKAVIAYTFKFGVILRIIISNETVYYKATIVVNEEPHSESA